MLPTEPPQPPRRIEIDNRLDTETPRKVQYTGFGKFHNTADRLKFADKASKPFRRNHVSRHTGDDPSSGLRKPADSGKFLQVLWVALAVVEVKDVLRHWNESPECVSPETQTHQMIVLKRSKINARNSPARKASIEGGADL